MRIGYDRHRFMKLEKGFLRSIGTRFNVYFMPGDLSCILAESLDGTERHLIPSIKGIPMAVKDRTPEDQAALEKQLGMKKSFKHEVQQDNIKRKELLEANNLYAGLEAQKALQLMPTVDGQQKLEHYQQQNIAKGDTPDIGFEGEDNGTIYSKPVNIPEHWIKTPDDDKDEYDDHEKYEKMRALYEEKPAQEDDGTSPFNNP